MSMGHNSSDSDSDASPCCDSEPDSTSDISPLPEPVVVLRLVVVLLSSVLGPCVAEGGGALAEGA